MLILLLAFKLFKNKIFVKLLIFESQYFKKEKQVEEKDIVYIQEKNLFIDWKTIAENLVSHVNVNKLYDVRILNYTYMWKVS